MRPPRLRSDTEHGAPARLDQDSSLQVQPNLGLRHLPWAPGRKEPPARSHLVWPSSFCGGNEARAGEGCVRGPRPGGGCQEKAPGSPNLPAKEPQVPHKDGVWEG